MQHLGRQQSGHLRAVSLVNSTASRYGAAKCPCVGFDHLKGTALMTAPSGKVTYPADVGASCQAWDQKVGTYPGCESGSDKDLTKDGEIEGWCKQPWCYVDPCKCDIPESPVVSSYLPTETYQGHPVYYSYATCGGDDLFTAELHSAACVNQKSEADCGKLEKCLWAGGKCAGKEVQGVCSTKVDETKYGAENCKCVGIEGLDGSVEAKPNGKLMEFPAEYGSTCKAWEENLHPDCKGDGVGEKPKWCDKAWCWVDPCSCTQAEPPKVTSNWLGHDVRFQGKIMYYSYTTCGAQDLFTEKYNIKACVNQKTADRCEMEEKCAWTGTRCLGKELVETCRGEPSSSLTLPPMPPMPFKSGALALAPLAVLPLMLAHLA